MIDIYGRDLSPPIEGVLQSNTTETSYPYEEEYIDNNHNNNHNGSTTDGESNANTISTLQRDGDGDDDSGWKLVVRYRLLRAKGLEKIKMDLIVRELWPWDIHHRTWRCRCTILLVFMYV